MYILCKLKFFDSGRIDQLVYQNKQKKKKKKKVVGGL